MLGNAPATACTQDDWVCGHLTWRRPCPPRMCFAPAGSMSSRPLTSATRAKSWRTNIHWEYQVSLAPVWSNPCKWTMETLVCRLDWTAPSDVMAHLRKHVRAAL